jgi:hypothetical protein
LGLGKWSPGLAYGIVVAAIIALPFFLLVRWLLRIGQRVIGIGCTGSALLIVLPMSLFFSFNTDEEHLSELQGMLCLLMGTGIISLPIWFFMLVPVMADRQDQREKAMSAGNASEQSKESP